MRCSRGVRCRPGSRGRAERASLPRCFVSSEIFLVRGPSGLGRQLSGTRRQRRERARQRPHRRRSPGQEHVGRAARARHGRPSLRRPRLRLRALRLEANVPALCARRGPPPARPYPIARSIRMARACLVYSATCRRQALPQLPPVGLVGYRARGKRGEGWIRVRHHARNGELSTKAGRRSEEHTGHDRARPEVGFVLSHTQSLMIAGADSPLSPVVSIRRSSSPASGARGSVAHISVSGAARGRGLRRPLRWLRCGRRRRRGRRPSW